MMLSWILWTCLATGVPSDEPDWSAVWQDLALLEGGEREGPGNSELAGELAELGRATEDRTRGALLLARIARWRKLPQEPYLEELAAGDFRELSASEAWLGVEVLSPGPARVSAARHALSARPELTRDELLLAWRAGFDEAQGLRLESGALPIQRTLHELNQAEWSAIDLSITLTLLGKRKELDLVLEQTLTREQAAGRPTAALWSQWGVSTLGFGDTELARDYLGRALAEGSPDAGLVLGLLDLEAGRHAAARNAFRPSILSDRPSAWALRGWGLCLLPGARVEPATIKSLPR